MRLAGFLSLTRPINSIVAGLAAIVAYLIATGYLIPETAILFGIVALITAAGNTINDFFDADIDAINRPDRPIPSGAVNRISARGFAVTLFLAGIPICIGITMVNSLILVAYAAKLKKMPLLGNIAVAYLSASIFLFGGAFSGWEGFIHMIPVAAITFFAMLSRELFKDAEDIEGDKAGGADTLPLRIGIKKTSQIALVSTVIAVVISFIPYLWWGAWYLPGIIAVDIIIIIAALRGLNCETPDCVKTSKVSVLLKAGMFASLIVFCLSAIFL